MSSIECSKCGNTGSQYVASAGVVYRCECWPQRRLNIIIETALIPPRYGRQGLEMIQPEGPAQATALAKLQQFAQDWPERLQAGDGVALMGAASRGGKTHLACSLARTIAAHHDLPYEPGEKYPILFVNVSEIMNGWRTFFAHSKMPDGQGYDQHAEDYRRLMRLEQRALSCPLLILDEVGEVTGTEFVTQKLYVLIEHRCSHLLPVIFTTNLDWDQLKQRYGDGGARIVGRLQEMTAEFIIHI